MVMVLSPMEKLRFPIQKLRLPIPFLLGPKGIFHNPILMPRFPIGVEECPM